MKQNEITRFNKAHYEFKRAFDYFLGFHGFPFVQADNWVSRFDNGGKSLIVYVEPKEKEERTLAFFLEQGTKEIMVYSYLSCYYQKTLIGKIDDEDFKKEILKFYEEHRIYSNWEKVNDYFTQIAEEQKGE